MRFLFPSNYFSPSQVDDQYLEQANCLRNLGFEISVISLENLALGTAKISPMPTLGEKLVYRGWMLTPEDYSLLINIARKVGADLLISLDEYTLMHYLPNWYLLIHDLNLRQDFFLLTMIWRKH
jgi:hypothetical protein